jgi:hypothetical protein
MGALFKTGIAKESQGQNRRNRDGAAGLEKFLFYVDGSLRRHRVAPLQGSTAIAN